MPLDLAEFCSALRAQGVTRIELEFGPVSAPAVGDFLTPAEVEKIIAGPEPEPKAAGVCVAAGCNAPNGHRFAPEYCRDHALSAAGVD